MNDVPIKSMIRFSYRKLGMNECEKIIIKDKFRTGLGQDFTHLANLFFEQSKVIDEDEEDAILAILTVDQCQMVVSSGKQSYVERRKCTSAEFSETVDDGDEKTKNRQLKRIYSHIFLEALEQATGMHNLGGILTGIRPMKLYHKYRQQGYSGKCDRTVNETSPHFTGKE